MARVGRGRYWWPGWGTAGPLGRARRTSGVVVPGRRLVLAWGRRNGSFRKPNWAGQLQLAPEKCCRGALKLNLLQNST